jgi:recombination protein RecR
MQIVPTSVERLIEELSKLPGIGPRTAERLAFHMLKNDPSRAHALGSAVEQLHAGVRTCTTCFNFAGDTQCVICTSPKRSRDVVAVVEEPFDVVAIEKTGMYHGLYHVLGGVISPLDGIGPERLQIASLVKRLAEGEITEVVLATNPSLEGESTAMYIRTQLEESGVTLTRLARGLPVGGDLEYADQITLGRAMQGRQSF